MTTDNSNGSDVAVIIMAAGRGSRMKGYDGNKTLLPLVPGASQYKGEKPLLLHIVDSLPAGPKAMIVHHCKQEVVDATRSLSVTYCEQPRLNGTGGAILAAQDFIAAQSSDRWIITMGDVPFVKKKTYTDLVRSLDDNDMVILGFRPEDKKQYGVVEIEAGKVARITEWKYWKDYDSQAQEALTVCNSGIYAVRKEALMHYLPILSSRPQIVRKEVNGEMVDIEEFFITDVIEYMVEDGKSVGYHVADDELETMGIDDPEALKMAQSIYREGMGPD